MITFQEPLPPCLELALPSWKRTRSQGQVLTQGGTRWSHPTLRQPKGTAPSQDCSGG